MNERELRKFGKKLLAELDLQKPPAPPEFCRRLSDYLGIPIILESRRLPDVRSYACVIPFPDRFVIAYFDTLVPVRVNYIIYHEIAHIILGHLTGNTSGVPLICGALFPRDEDEGTPQTSFYASPQEWEAEIMAAILSGWSKLPIRADWKGLGPHGDALGRLFGVRGV
ncbi:MULTISPECIES: hypothetical protein [unclassified Pseudonocardia]|uniref:hypothetical protein n=1 Tax=unclassified Pseudonocardia TaxID=2619320 RepID=UPI000A6E39C0|nr:hypothetical protein [Pseudonocardia sp. Ae406_Ps2]